MPQMKPQAAGNARRAPRELDDEIVKIIQGSRKPLSAYDIVDSFARRRKRIVPSQVYRCLQRLQELGEIRRIESLRAFCVAGERREAVVYCEQCGTHTTICIEEVVDTVEEAVRAQGFDELRTIVEVSGRCEKCRGESVTIDEAG